jgi:hypothetical protein
MLLMMGFALFVHFPGSVYGGVVMGLERFDVLNRYNFTLLVVRNLATFLAVSRYPSVVLVGVINMVTLLAEPVVAAVFARRLLPELKITVRAFSRARAKQLFTFSTQSFLFTLSEKLINYTDEFVISRPGPRGGDPLRHPLAPRRLRPRRPRQGHARAHARRVGHRGEGRHGHAAKRLALRQQGRHVPRRAGVPRVSRVGPPRAHPLARPHLRRSGDPVLLWLALAFVVQVAGRGIARPIFEGLGELTVPARITVVEGVTNLVLSVIFVRTGLGVAGVAMATFIPAAISGVLVMPWFVCRRLGVSFGLHLARTFVRTAPPLVPCYLLLRGAERLGFHRHFLTLGATCFAVLLVYLAFAALVTFDAEERAMMRARFGR